MQAANGGSQLHVRVGHRIAERANAKRRRKSAANRNPVMNLGAANLRNAEQVAAGKNTLWRRRQ